MAQLSRMRQNRLIDDVEIRRRRRGQRAQRCSGAQHRLEFAPLSRVIAQAGIDRIAALNPIQTDVQHVQEFLIIIHHRPPPHLTGDPGRAILAVAVV